MGAREPAVVKELQKRIGAGRRLAAEGGWEGKTHLRYIFTGVGFIAVLRAATGGIC